MTIRYFDRLGRFLERQWRTHHYDERAFPMIATAALRAHPPSRHVVYAEIIEELFFGEAPTIQDPDDSFGEPPVVVFRNPRFYIEVLCWLDGTTVVHQHAFSGAFHVLAGSSIHSMYKFDLRRRINGAMIDGNLVFLGSELLGRGDTRSIPSGDSLIHATFHLDCPTLSVVVRTNIDRDRLPQYHYQSPHFGFDGSGADPIMRRRTKVLDMLIETDRVAYRELVVRVAAEGDLFAMLETARHIFDNTAMLDMGTDDALLSSLIVTARERFGDVADRFLPTFEESRRISTLVHHRELIRNPHHRFFLALLINVPARAHIFDLVAQHTGRDAREAVSKWLRELTVVGLGVATLLEIEVSLDETAAGVRADDLLHAVINCTSDGLRGADLLGCVAHMLPSESAAALTVGILELAEQLLHSSLRALFLAAPTGASTRTEQMP